jgi:hypothetical protein
MAYVSQEDKKMIAPAIKKILAENGLKGSLSIRNHSTLILTIKSGVLDFINNRNKKVKEEAEWKGYEFYESTGKISVNVYHVDNAFTDKCAEVLSKLVDALKGPDYFDDSDIQTDYFNCSHYVDIKIGTDEKAYNFSK